MAQDQPSRPPIDHSLGTMRLAERGYMSGDMPLAHLLILGEGAGRDNLQNTPSAGRGEGTGTV